MTSTNLIPAYRQNARIRRRLCRIWIAVCIAHLSVLTMAYPLVRTVLASDASIDDELTTVQGKIDETEKSNVLLRHEVEETHATLEATRLVENQADWSLLLTLISVELGEDLVLKECVLKPQSDETPKVSMRGSTSDSQSGRWDDAPDAFMVELKGYGKTHRSVSQFVLRLERTELFRRVTLEESRREGFLQGQAITFQLSCLLNGEKGLP